jgi:3-oxoacyl-[acyl-carrier-protein] synthase-3
MGFTIRAVSSAFGEIEVPLKDLFPDSQKTISKTGIEKVYETKGTALELATRALNRLLEENNLGRQDIDCLIYVTQSPSFFLPSGACLLQDRCGLSQTLLAFDIGQGCSGFVQALSISSKLSQSFENIVVVCSDTYRSKIQPTDRSTSMLFSDAASATWLTTGRTIKILSESHMTDGAGRDFLYHKVPISNDPEFIHMSGADVLLFAQRYVPLEIKRALEFCGIDSSQVSNWFFHQASKLVLDSLDKRVSSHVPAHRNLEQIGNTVSSSIPILLKDHLKSLESGINVICGFGVGLSIATLVIGPCSN